MSGLGLLGRVSIQTEETLFQGVLEVTEEWMSLVFRVLAQLGAQDTDVELQKGSLAVTTPGLSGRKKKKQ